MWFERARDWVLDRRWTWLLESPDPAVRRQAIVEMESTPRAIVPRLLVPLLADLDEAVSHRAWTLLARYGDEARAALRAELSGARQMIVREQAAHALGHLGGPEDRQALEGELKSEAKEIRSACRKAIERIDRREREATAGETRRRALRRLARPRLVRGAEGPAERLAPLFPATGFQQRSQAAGKAARGLVR